MADARVWQRDDGFHGGDSDVRLSENDFVTKSGEIQYLQNLDEAGRWHAANKPFSDAQCHELLEDISASLALLPPPPGRLLDLGCGTGWTSSFFASRGYDVVGLDIASDMIAVANRVRDQAGLSNLTYLERDYEQLDYHEEFDIAVFFDSLHHAADEAMTLRRAFEALKPGGMCVTHEPGAGHGSTAVAREAVKKYDVTEKEMHPRKVIALGREAGFREFFVFPVPRENRVMPYRLDNAARVSGDRDGSRAGPGNPLANAWDVLSQVGALVVLVK
jgi:SAM-dependent methyltransferase